MPGAAVNASNGYLVCSFLQRRHYCSTFGCVSPGWGIQDEKSGEEGTSWGHRRTCCEGRELGPGRVELALCAVMPLAGAHWMSVVSGGFEQAGHKVSVSLQGAPCSLHGGSSEAAEEEKLVIG